MYHVSFFQTQQGDRLGGWTFNLWNTLDNESDLKVAITDMGNRINSGTGAGATVVKARYSIFPGFREADEVKFTYGTTLETNHDLNADYQTTAVQLQLQGAGKYKVNLWLSGIRDEWIFDAGRLNPAYATSPSFVNIKNLLIANANGWVIFALLKTRPKKLVESISDTGVVKSTAHGFATTDLADINKPPVRVMRVKGNKYPNKIWSIVVLTPDTFQLVGFNDPTPGGYNVRKAIIRPQVYGPVSIANVKPIRATSHRRGRPTDLLSGKAKPRS